VLVHPESPGREPLRLQPAERQFVVGTTAASKPALCWPFLLTSAAVSPAPFSLMSAQATLASSRAKISAVARPMPLAAPVIMMVFPRK
jgi:hypothetical protein